MACERSLAAEATPCAYTMQTVPKQILLGTIGLEHTCSCGRNAQHPNSHLGDDLQRRVLASVVPPKAHTIGDQGRIFKGILWDSVLPLASVLQLRHCCIAKWPTREIRKLLCLHALLHADAINVGI